MALMPPSSYPAAVDVAGLQLAQHAAVLHKRNKRNNHHMQQPPPQHVSSNSRSLRVGSTL
jgi:hypothetical protein